MRSLTVRGAVVLGIVSAAASGQAAELILVTPDGSTTMNPVGQITVEVFVNGVIDPTFLLGYDATIEIVPTDGSTGSLGLVDPDTVDPDNLSIFVNTGVAADCKACEITCNTIGCRTDWVFYGGGFAMGFANPGDLSIGGFGGPVGVLEPKYCGTYVFLASADALGDFEIAFVLVDPENPEAKPTNVVDAAMRSIPFTVTGLTVTVVESAFFDDCVDSELISDDGVTEFSTEHATTDGPDLPQWCDEGNDLSFGQDVWLDYAATCTGVLTISTCDNATNFDTRLAVYGDESPACICPTDNTTLLACNDDDPDGCVPASGASEMSLAVTEGNCYTIRVGGWGTEEGTGNLSIICVPDLCTDAAPAAVDSTIVGSTENTEINDSTGLDCGSGVVDSPGVWYSVTGTGGLMTASLCDGAFYDTRLTVYSGTCSALTCVADADDTCGSQESVSWCSTPGTEYLILVHGVGDASGTFTLDISDASCDDGNTCTDNSCLDGTCVYNINYDDATFCCNPADGALTEIDDQNVCTDDKCDPETGNVSHWPVPDHVEPACDDGDICTVDECQSGSCVNVDVNGRPCGPGAPCPGSAEGFSRCVGDICECNPVTLKLIAEPGSLSVEGCYATGEFITVIVDLGPRDREIISNEEIVGAQFFLEYDAFTLAFVSIQPGIVIDPSSPFAMPLGQSIDPVLGTIDYMIGTSFGSSTRSPTTVAVVTFQVTAECDALVRFRPSGPNGEQNLVVTVGGGDAYVNLFDPPDIKINGTPPTLTECPADVTVSPDPGLFTAAVGWPAVVATDSCDGSLPVTCVPPSESLFSPGTTPVTCSATNSCGVSDACIFNVTVEPPVVTVDVELSATTAPGPFNRCITFELWDCDGPVDADHVTVAQTLTFANGLASAVDVPIPGGAWECITARDTLHTLRSTAPDFTTGDGIYYTASFVGSRASGGHWLVGGNLNDDEFIDIRDFAILFPHYLTQANPDTPCGTAGPDANVNGDEVVDLLDLVFVSGNSLTAAEPDCCGASAASERSGPLTAIPVRELHRMGLGHLAVADIDGNGTVDIEELIALPVGNVPAERNDGSLRDVVGVGAAKATRRGTGRR